jgi:hypothetical protein
VTDAGTTRRRFLAASAGTVGALAFGPGFWRSALAQGSVVAGPNPYGALQPPDANGLRLPPGFRSRIVARAHRPVTGTVYPWHVFPDGGATFPAADGGWVLASNSESLAASGAGSSAIRFRSDGSVADAYRILGGTNANCAGGPTPWGTWLSCEEYAGGHVWECDPQRAGQGTIRPAMGTFNHEAACVDPVGRHVYMTEDEPDGGLYRFTPARYPELSAGRLEIAVAAAAGHVGWRAVPDPSAITAPTRNQVAGTQRFRSGEGIWFDSGHVYVSTKGDNRVWDLDTATGRIEALYDAAAIGAGAPLRGVDNLTVTRAGELFVCEDGDNMEICLITRERTVAPFLRLEGAAAQGPAGQRNEMAGVAFNPAGDRMYFSAQRAYDFGVTYEVSGPFAGSGAAPAPAPASAPPTAGALTARAPHVTAARRVSVGWMRHPGYAVVVRTKTRGTAVIALRTSELGTVPGKRGSTDRPRHVTLAKTRKRVVPGRNVLRLRVGPRTAAKLRSRRATRARLTVQVRDEDGTVQVVTRRARVVPRRRRARSR